MEGEGDDKWNVDRLELQAELAADAEERAITGVGFPDAGEVLDVGCGPGAVASRLLARRPRLVVDGLERDASLAARARTRPEPRPRAVFEGDVTRPETWVRLYGRYDAAFTRLVLRHVPDALGVVRGMASSVRPGGRVVLVDSDDGALSVGPALEPLVADAFESIYAVTRARGADPRAARVLPELARRAGLVDLAVQSVVLTTAGLDGLHGRRGTEVFRELLSFLWIDPATRELLPERRALAAAFDAWVSAPGSFGVWALTVLGGTRV
ncbi:methyltransferase domain-containing protein [Myxococcota bacterium]|nr:methyltransferase domain-containing protein [Myxococcota bacterium]